MANEYGNGDFGDMTLRFIGITEALQMTVALGASDLHITVGRTPMVRIDGALSALPGASLWTLEMADREIRKITGRNEGMAGRQDRPPDRGRRGPPRRGPGRSAAAR